jgi:hypothetical protein
MNTGNNTNTQTVKSAPRALSSSSASTSLDALNPEPSLEVLSPGAEFIQSYSPRKSTLSVSSKAKWSEIGPVVREVAAPLSTLQPSTLQPLMTAVTSLCVWAVGEGVALSAASVLSHSSIENFTAQAGQSASSYRAMLRRVAKANGVRTPAITGALPRRTRTSAYTAVQIDALRSYATALTNDHRRTVLFSMIYLSAGCGLVGDDLRRAAPGDVHQHDDVLVVRVGEHCVPMLAMFVSDFTDFLSNFDASSKIPFLGGRKSKNVTDRATGWVASVPGLPPFSVSALRSFFAVEHLARGTGTIELLTMLGIKSAEALDAYIEQVDVEPATCWAFSKEPVAKKRGGRS